MVFLRKYNGTAGILLFSFSLLAVEKNDISSQLLKLLISPEKRAEKPLVESPDTQVKFSKDIFMQKNVEYLEHFVFESEQDVMPIIEESSLSLKERKNLQKYGDFVKQGYEVPWCIKFVNKKVGYGVFAESTIEEGQFIGEYTGIMFSKKSAADAATLDRAYIWTIFPPQHYPDRNLIFLVDAKKAANFTRFINHSFHPNVLPVPIYMEHTWHMIYIAGKKIEPGEQLLVDYGEAYWGTNKPEELS